MTSYNQAIQLRPDDAAAYSNRGNALRELGQLGAAMASYNQAIQLKTDYGRGLLITAATHYPTWGNWRKRWPAMTGPSS